jgi:hypothetical protein
MKGPVARIGRKNFIENIINRLPVITTLYGVQCLLVFHFAKDVNIGDFATWVGLGLISFVLSMMFYERFHQVLLYKDHIKIQFGPLGVAKAIAYKDIDQIIVPDEEYKFATIILKLKNESEEYILFADYPIQTKKFINKLISEHNDELYSEAA